MKQRLMESVRRCLFLLGLPKVVYNTVILA